MNRLEVSNNVIALFFSLLDEMFDNIYVWNFGWYIEYEFWQARSFFVRLCLCYLWFHWGRTTCAALGIQGNFPKGKTVNHIALHPIISHCVVLYRVVSFPSQMCVSSSGRLSSGGQGLQERPRRLASRAGETVDLLPQVPPELLHSRRLPLLLQHSAGRDRRHPHQRQRRGDGHLLHSLQQVLWKEGKLTGNKLQDQNVDESGRVVRLAARRNNLSLCFTLPFY